MWFKALNIIEIQTFRYEDCACHFHQSAVKMKERLFPPVAHKASVISHLSVPHQQRFSTLDSDSHRQQIQHQVQQLTIPFTSGLGAQLVTRARGTDKDAKRTACTFPSSHADTIFPSLKTSKTTRTTAMLPLILLWPPTQTGSHYVPLQQHSAHSKCAILWLPPYYFLSHFTSLISSFVCTFSSPIILKSAWAIFPLPASPQAT